MHQKANRKTFVLVCVAAGVIGAFAISALVAPHILPLVDSESRLPVTAQAEEIPQYVIYDQLLRQMAAFNRKAEEIEGRGEDGSFLATYHQRGARLDEEQAQALRRVVLGSADELAELDAQAREIIDRTREQHPHGRLDLGIDDPSTDEVGKFNANAEEENLPPLPELPSELADLQGQRVRLVLRARGELQSALGDAAFNRFDGFVQQEITSSMRQAPAVGNSPAPPRSLGAQEPK